MQQVEQQSSVGRTWTRVLELPKRNLRFARCDVSGRVSAFDFSGVNPDRTEDGPLWLDTSRPMRVGASFGAIPVLKDRENCEGGYHCCVDAEFAVQVARQFGFRLVVEGKLALIVQSILGSEDLDVTYVPEPRRSDRARRTH